MKVALTGTGPTHISRNDVTDLSIFSATGVLSLQTDIISFWFKCVKPVKIGWLWLTFNIGDNTKSFYHLRTRSRTITGSSFRSSKPLIRSTPPALRLL